MAAGDAARSPGQCTADARLRLDGVRGLFADTVARDAIDARLGSIVLRPDQLETVRRVRDQLRRDGGCLLADDVGSGKTYVALAIAREWTRPLVIAPASLRATWDQAAHRADIHVRVASHESLSRGRLPDEPFDGIIVDESHRFRDTSRRHEALARLTAHVPLLMLSATPMQNHGRELAAQLALFLGEVAFGMPPEVLARWIVRSSTPVDIALPLVAPPRWIALDADDAAVLEAILALPPPPRAVDAGDGRVLLQLSLVRAWASSRAALVATIRRRWRTLAAIEQCHAEGRLPSRRELRSWHAGDEVQLGFPTLLAATVVERERADSLTAAIDEERVALDMLMRALERGDDPDAARAAALREMRASHAEASILAFSEWASTVRAYWSALRGNAGVGLLTAREGRIASGRIARDALLARFAPRAQGAPEPPPHERVTLLLATDLLSEGVNLQDASVVVHLDLPWNPARMAQRLGRIRRPGGAHEIASYLMVPPARAALLLRVESRLRAKLHRTERTIGRSLAVLPMLAPGAGDRLEATPQRNTTGTPPLSSHPAPTRERAPPLSAAELQGEIARRLAGWRRADVGDRHAHDQRVAIAAVEASASGWVALLDDRRLVALNCVAQATPRPSDDAAEVVRALELASGPPRCASCEERDAALGALNEWITLDWTQRCCGLAAAASPLRRRVLRALDDAVRRTPRHRRATLLGRIARLRHALILPLPLGLERGLDALVKANPVTCDWIEEAANLLERARAQTREGDARGPATLRALILFG